MPHHLRARLVLALSFLLLAGPKVAAQATPLDTIKIRMGIDGRLWKAFGELPQPEIGQWAKFLVLKGLFDGLAFGYSPLIRTDSITFHDDDTWMALVRSVDQFYADYRNERVFLVQGLQIITMERRGTPAAVVDKRVRQMRQKADSIASSLERNN